MGTTCTCRRGFARQVSLVLSVVLSAGCATLPPPSPKVPEHAFNAPQVTSLGKQVQSTAPAPTASGFRVLQSGEDAFGALNALIGLAQRSLDLQYYIVRDEISARKLLHGVYAAAQRGVKVRLLVDDLNTAGEEDVLLCLANQRDIEVRLYNPFPAGRFSTLSRLVASATDVGRISARMHNKMLVADNALAVTGGRNLGDAYFVQSKQANFLDLDLLVAGPVVRKLSASFDTFWNSDLAYPISTIVTRKPECNGPDPQRPQNDRAAPAQEPAPDTNQEPRQLERDLRQGKLALTWAPATLLADKPSKITSKGQPTSAQTVSDDIELLLMAAQKEVIIISPYFVPGKRGMALIETLRRRGVKVRALTNSLAATDAPAVHIGYARYREQLLEMGTELYELRPQIDSTRVNRDRFGSSRASLHAKALVIDRSIVLVGSMNMDPRSANLNSEIGLVLRSPPIAEQLVRLYDDVTRNSSYHVELWDGTHLRWTANEPNAAPEIDDSEPAVNPGLRLLLWLLSPVAPEEML
jgi:phosphatidylserine/phosphatidylglycerophosphate/cardiolipin synthase-like enzyme